MSLPSSRRDLTLAKTLDLEKTFTESRIATVMYQLDSHLIEDINSTETQMIDDLKKVSGVF